MTHTDSKSKIIDLGKRAEGGTARKIGELLSNCESTTIDLTRKGLQALFERVDDSLFDMAERADSNQVQTQYFDGMREIRRQRATVESEFKRQLSRGFREFANGHSAVREDIVEPDSAEGLSLVENDELEQSLAVSNMVSRAETRLSSALHALNSRLGMVRGGSRCENSENPVGPQAIAYAFRKGAEHWEVEIRVRLLIFKLFEKHVVAHLPELYKQLNEQLAGAGVLPHLKYTIPRPRIQGGGPAMGGPAMAGGAEGELVADDESTMEAGSLEGASIEAGGAHPDTALEQQLFATMQSLLQARRARGVAPGHGTGTSGGQPVPAYRPNDVLSALSALQQQVQGLSSPSTGGEHEDYYGTLQKDQLLNQIRRVSGKRGGALATRDEDAIDLVSMLFEYILEDSNLPSPIQATLARLQIPYLKVAVLDRHLFAQRAHPARRLLDALARSGIGWTEDADRNELLLGKIRDIVDRVLSEFSDDLGLFDELLSDFESFQKKSQRRSLAAEKRTTEATRGRERLLQARRQAAQEVLARIGEKNLPEVVRYLLTRPWANVLVLILLRQGDESREWDDALRLIDELLWSCEAKPDEQAITQLKRRLPWIERQIRLGLRLVAMHEDDIDRQLEEIGRIHQRVIRGQPAIPERAEPTAEEAVDLAETDDMAAPRKDGDEGESVLADDEAPDADSAEAGSAEARETAARETTDGDSDTAGAPQPAFAAPQGGGDNFVEEIVLESEAEQASSDSETIEDEHTRATRELKVGVWIEFTDPEDQVTRAKLSWISPITQNYLFVNRNGIKVYDKSLNALAVEFRRGTARVLEDVPLFDRALDAIVTRLRKDQPTESAEKPQ